LKSFTEAASLKGVDHYKYPVNVLPSISTTVIDILDRLIKNIGIYTFTPGDDGRQFIAEAARRCLGDVDAETRFIDSGRKAKS
jgi:hypothetical protein